jgi:hypothetical protein
VNATFAAKDLNGSIPFVEVGGLNIARLGDLNGDGIVGILDIYILAKAFKSKPGDPNWNEVADVDRNGVINIVDIFMVAKEFGKTVD